MLQGEIFEENPLLPTNQSEKTRLISLLWLLFTVSGCQTTLQHYLMLQGEIFEENPLLPNRSVCKNRAYTCFAVAALESSRLLNNSTALSRATGGNIWGKSTAAKPISLQKPCLYLLCSGCSWEFKIVKQLYSIISCFRGKYLRKIHCCQPISLIKLA